MKVIFNKKFNLHADFLVRRCGYGQIKDNKTGQISYVRRLRSDFYPRFHLYINSEDPLILNLHLDQKKASYEGYTAHGGDYDSEIVKQEAQRIYNSIIREGKEGEEEKEGKEGEEKGFWAKLFGKKD
ncbi:hypothetical protein JW977_04860 [Candidatus Falkowbacteria bacterium]|nr:hypothetical protein [Candidatus Falkowbacteria bacterium]